jgi:hypothetical protein
VVFFPYATGQSARRALAPSVEIAEGAEGGGDVLFDLEVAGAGGGVSGAGGEVLEPGVVVFAKLGE